MSFIESEQEIENEAMETNLKYENI